MSPYCNDKLDDIVQIDQIYYLSADVIYLNNLFTTTSRKLYRPAESRLTTRDINIVQRAVACKKTRTTQLAKTFIRKNPFTTFFWLATIYFICPLRKQLIQRFSRPHLYLYCKILIFVSSPRFHNIVPISDCARCFYEVHSN